MTTYKPILFSTEMVQAILAGRKTQTRRVIDTKGMNLNNFIPGSPGIIKQEGYFQFILKTDFEKAISFRPKYQPGDILWVRETFAQGVFNDYCYKASGQLFYEVENWTNSIFMPKEAARIFLKVTNVRVERLQDISDNDAIGEGIDCFNHGYGGSPVGVWYRNYKYGTNNCSPRYSFQTLWDSINAKKAPWDSNPWVWVYNFEQIEKPQNWPL